MAELVDRVQIEWAALEYAVASLTASQLLAPGPEGWSVKDHLMHIGDWEKATTAVLRRRPQYEGFGINEGDYGVLVNLSEAPDPSSVPKTRCLPRRMSETMRLAGSSFAKCSTGYRSMCAFFGLTVAPVMSFPSRRGARRMRSASSSGSSGMKPRYVCSRQLIIESRQSPRPVA